MYIIIDGCVSVCLLTAVLRNEIHVRVPDSTNKSYRVHRHGAFLFNDNLVCVRSLVWYVPTLIARWIYGKIRLHHRN